jgi:hypothetical protein
LLRITSLKCVSTTETLSIREGLEDRKGRHAESGLADLVAGHARPAATTGDHQNFADTHRVRRDRRAMDADVIGLVRNRDVVGNLDLRHDETVLKGEFAAHLADPESELLVRAEEPGRHLLAEQQLDLRRLQHRLDGVLVALLVLLRLHRLLCTLLGVEGLDLPWNEPAEEGHAAAERGEGHERQTRHHRQQNDEARGDHQCPRIAAELAHHGLIRRAGRTAARDEQTRGKRNDQRRNLRDETVADRELDENIGGLADLHVMAEIADDDAAEDIDRRDDQAGDRIAAHEFRGTIHRTIEGAFLFQLPAAALRFLFIDKPCR